MRISFILGFVLFFGSLVIGQDKTIQKSLLSKNAEEQLEAFANIAGDEEKYLPELIKLLGNDNPDVANQAALCIGTLGPRGVKAIPALIDNMKNTERLTAGQESLWHSNGHALVAMGKDAIPALLNAIPKANQAQYLGICGALHEFGTEAAPALDAVLKVLKEKKGDATYQWASLYVLEAIGNPSKKGLPLLLNSLKDENFQLQVMACRALGAIGPDAKEAVPTLTNLAREGIPSVRGRAALALAGIGYKDAGGEELLALLAGLLKDPNQVVRERAVIALGLLGKDATPALEAIRDSANDIRFAARSDAAVAMYRITGEAKESCDLLVSLFTSIDHGLPAMHAIGELGAGGVSALPQLLERMQDEDPSYAIEGCEAIAMIGKGAESALPLLTELESHPDPEVRMAAQAAIKQVKGK